MLFKKKEEQITNSTQIKEILDKSKDISIAEEMGIMTYIYDLEAKSNISIKYEDELIIPTEVHKKLMNEYTDYIITPTGIHINKKNIKR